MDYYLIFRVGNNGNGIGSSGISTNLIELINTPKFKTPVEAKVYMMEQNFPKNEYIIMKAEIYRH